MISVIDPCPSTQTWSDTSDCPAVLWWDGEKHPDVDGDQTRHKYLMIIYQKHTIIDSVEPAVSLMIGQKSCDFVFLDFLFHDFSLRISSPRAWCLQHTWSRARLRFVN